MKPNTEPDSFKKNIRDKHMEYSVFSASDAEIWRRVLDGIEKEKVERKSISIFRKINNYPIYGKAAAVLLLNLAALGIYYWSNSFPANSLAEKKIVKENAIAHVSVQQNNVSTDNTFAEVKSIPFEEASIVRSKGKIKNYDLLDGSIVVLNTGSSIQIEKGFNEDGRSLMLEGEAYFEVQRNEKMPFKVYFEGGELEVKGTKFNVRSVEGEDYNEITVTEGVVAVKGLNNENFVNVRAGEQVKIYKNKTTAISMVTSVNYISWKTGDLVFKNIRLKEVAMLLSRFHKKEIAVDENIENCKYTGDLSDLSLEESLEIIKITNSVTIQKTPDKIMIVGVICD